MRSLTAVAALIAAALLVPGCLQSDERADTDDLGSDPTQPITRTRTAEAHHEFTGSITAGAATPILGVSLVAQSLHDLRIPADLQGGEVHLEWDTANAPAGLRLYVLRGDDVQHVEQSSTSPLVMELDPDDARIRGANGFSVWLADPGAGAAIEYTLTVHLQYLETVTEEPDEEEEDAAGDHSHDDEEPEA